MALQSSKEAQSSQRTQSKYRLRLPVPYIPSLRPALRVYPEPLGPIRSTASHAHTCRPTPLATVPPLIVSCRASQPIAAPAQLPAQIHSALLGLAPNDRPPLPDERSDERSFLTCPRSAPASAASKLQPSCQVAGFLSRTPEVEVADHASDPDLAQPAAPENPPHLSNIPPTAPSAVAPASAATSGSPSTVAVSSPADSRSESPTHPPQSAAPPQTQAPRQVLGRRQRSSACQDDGDGDGDQDCHDGNSVGVALGSSATTDTAIERRLGKRRRRNSMLPDRDGASHSNRHSSYSTSNGSSAQPPRSVTANGTHKAAANASGGGSMRNGKEVARSPPATYCGHDREETTRILIQALSDMGYHDAAESVSRDSGYTLESQAVAEFRAAVLAGEWAEAEELLFGVDAPLLDDGRDSPVARPSGLLLSPGSDRNIMRFWLRQQKYLELLEDRDSTRALAVLRNELTPLYQETSKLHFLSSLLMCQTPEELKQKADWDGAQGMSRQLLLSELSHCISPSVMLPENRLAVLLQQVKDGQILSCLYHCSSGSPSLYCDHYCSKDQFPSQVVHQLDKSVGEVWQMQFSNDGTQLASSGSGDAVLIWGLNTFDIRLKLSGHEEGAGNIAWSPDDSMLLTCGRDRHVRIWSTANGEMIRVFERFDEPVSSCVWAADGQSVFIGSLDRERSLCQWNLQGERVYTWTKKHRTEDLAISPDGHWLAAKDDTNKVHVYNFLTRELEYEVEAKGRASSISISQDSRLLLMNTDDGIVQLYDLARRGIPLQSYLGCTGGRFLIRCDFGGANESFVVSGSEDGKLAIWHKAMGHLVYKLEAHESRCNAVRWNPADPCMFATCSDDGKIKIWSNQDYNANRPRTAIPASSNGAFRSTA